MAATRMYRAHPQSAPGDFYVINHECAACGAPHEVAPDLIGWDTPEMNHCIWKKQPETSAEFEQAFAAFDASDVECYRYAGNDPKIMARIGLEFRDQVQASPWYQPQRYSSEYEFVPGSIPIHFTLSASRPAQWFSKLRQTIRKLFKAK